MEVISFEELVNEVLIGQAKLNKNMAVEYNNCIVYEYGKCI